MFHQTIGAIRRDNVNKVAHEISYEREGKAEMRSHLPICSCGWKGRKEYAYNDYCHTNVQEQISDHLQQARRETP